MVRGSVSMYRRGMDAHIETEAKTNRNIRKGIKGDYIV